MASKESNMENEVNLLKKRKDLDDKFNLPYKKIKGHIPNGDLSNPLVELINGTNESFTQKSMCFSNSHSHGSSKDSGRMSIASTLDKKTMSTEYTDSDGKENSVLSDLLNMDFDNWDDVMDTSEDYNLDLTEPQHCKILNISRLHSKIILTLLSTKNKHKGLCQLEGLWYYTNLELDKTIYVTAKNVEGTWIVNNQHGLLVIEPDRLVSSTAVVGSLWCKRRSVLSERYKGFESTNQVMLVGSLVHSILQTALKNNISGITNLKEIMNKFIQNKRNIKTLYECSISLKTLEEHVLQYVPKIQDFLNYYMDSSSNIEINKDCWKGKIDTIEDIEENIWCPDLGIKGKIDVTIKTNNQIMPLEVKTGKATVSLEHRGQILLYLLMMKKVGYNVTSGLLLYLKENILKEIPATQNEQRDLIQLRNELAHFLTKTPELKNDVMLPPELPEPINHPGCSNCPYQIICTAYAHFSNEDISSKKHLKKLQEQTLQYCSQSHIEYFMKWSCLLIMEGEMNGNKSKEVKEIYLTDPEEREKNGRCLTNLIISIASEGLDDMIEHSFEKIDNTSFNFLKSSIAGNNYVIVSTKKRYAVAAGLVTNISTNSISVSLERNLREKYPNEKFTIDTYDSSLIQTFQFSSLALLLEDTLKAENLRKIIIDKMVPTFKPTLPKIIGTKGKTILRRLNLVQQRAVLKAITANQYFLIKGMPGTGKTATIVALIQLLYELGKTVLITSHTNSAVDNVCLKLLEFGVKFIRLGSESRIHRDLWEYSEHYLTRNCRTPEEYEAVYHSAQILAVTCIGSSHPVLTKRTLDFCIVDESTQVLQSSVFRPLYACKTFILIGDPDQLPAVVRNNKARELGMTESLFERLYRPEATIALNINYRMNKTITYLANCLTYNGELKVANSDIENATIRLDTKHLESVYEKDSWIFKVVDDSLEKSVQFLDTGPVWNLLDQPSWKIHKSYGDSQTQSGKESTINVHEAGIIFKIIKALLKAGTDPTNIGVIASYRNQVEQLIAIVQNHSIDVNTVDQFQGKDKSIIIYSCVSSKDTTIFKTPVKHEILEDKRRINVAVTRAKHKLIIVGDVETLSVYSTFKKLLPNFENNTLKLFECKDFSWEKILDLDCY